LRVTWHVVKEDEPPPELVQARAKARAALAGKTDDAPL
jgi:hypothetical protein